MEIKIDVGLDDIFEKLPYNEYDEPDNNFYRMRDKTEFKDELIAKMVEVMLDKINYFSESNNIAYQVKEELIKNYKDEIIDKIVEKTSKSIISGKRIRDFRKELDNDDA